MSLLKITILAIVCYLCIGSSLVSAENNLDISVCYKLHPTAIAKRITCQPVLDGLLDDVVWKQTDIYGGNFVTSNGHRKVEDQTKFQVCYDNKNLYIAVKAYDTSAGSIRKIITKRDGKVWIDDCIEILIDSNCDRKSFYHFILNPIATIYDAFIGIDGKENSKWNCPIKAKAKIKSDSWQVELAIPLTSIGINNIDKVKKVGFNICREQRSRDGLILSQWSPSLNSKSGFLFPKSFGLLWFDIPTKRIDANSIKLRWQKNHIVLSANVFDKTGSAIIKVTYSAENDRRKWHAVQCRCKLNQCDLSLEPLVGQNALIRINLFNDNACLLDDVVILKVNLPQKVKLNIVAPHYKRCIFPGQDIRNIQAYVTSDFDGKINVEFVNEKRAVLYHKIFSDAKTKNEIIIPCKNLDVGRYILSAKLMQSGKVVSVVSKTIRKLKRKKGMVWINKDRILIKDGKPIMPIGYLGLSYKNYPSLSELAKQSVSAGHTYYYRSVNDKLLQTLLDNAAQNNIGVLIYPFSDIANKESTSATLSSLARREIIKRVNKYKNHLGLLGWYLADEPEIHNQPISRYKEMYNLISELDPYHPCIILNDTLSVIRNYAQACDVTMPDPYIVPRKIGLPVKPMTYISGFMDAARSSGKAVWITPQAFDYAAYTVSCSDTRAPTYREERCMTYLAMIHGARGFLYYALPYILPDAELRVGMPFLTKELSVISNIMLTKGKSHKLKTSSKHIEAIIKQTKQSVIIIAVNTIPKKLTTYIEIPKTVKNLYVLSENRSIKAENAKIKDTFGKYDTHIYYFNIPQANKLATINTIEREIRIYKRKIAEENRDNLAFVGNGTVIKANKYQFSVWLNNGIVNEPNWKSSASGKKPAWVEITLKKQQPVSRVVVNATPFYYNSVRLKKYTVLVWKDNSWRKVAIFSNDNNKQKVTELDFTPVTTKRLRIEFQKPSYIVIAEIQVYGQKTKK